MPPRPRGEPVELGSTVAIRKARSRGQPRLAQAAEAIAAVRHEDGSLADGGIPETRRHRLAEAAFLLLLAGTDEHGESGDLALSAALFRRAAAW